MNQLVYIGLGVAAGWTIAKWLSGSSLVRNPEWRIQYDEFDRNLGDVFVGDKRIGSVVNLGVFGQKKVWQAGDQRDFPMPGEYATAGAAAEASYKVWAQKKTPEKAKPKLKPKKTDVPFEIMEITVPVWVKNVEVEPVAGSTDRFVVWVDDDKAGFIDRRGHNWDAYFLFKGKKIQLEIGTTRKRAITAVYCAFLVFQNISEAVEPGQEKSYFPRRFVTMPPTPLKLGQTSEQRQELPQIVEEFYTTMHPFQQTAGQIASATKIPVAEVEQCARKLAKNRIIYGVASRERIGTFRRIEQVEQSPTHSFVPGRRRVIVSAPDIKKLRKSGKLTPEEKKLLPRVRHGRVYRFALSGPNGEIGLYESD